MRLWPRRSGTSLDLLVVGLGNPGRDYVRNRHNVGRMVTDELARRHGGSWRSKFSGLVAEIRIDGVRNDTCSEELLALAWPKTGSHIVRFFVVFATKSATTNHTVLLGAAEVNIIVKIGSNGRNS